jgi:phosphoglycolate phosphatase
MPIPPLALVLDLDGTLVDSLPDIQLCLNQALETFGRRPVALDEVRAMLGDGASILMGRALARTGAPGDDAEIQALLESFLPHYEAQGAANTRCYPGVEATLDRLAAQGHRLGICSNKPHKATEDLLASLGMRHRFQAVFGGDALPWRKPDPRHLHATVDAMGAADRPVVMVGDSGPDAQVAANAGVPFVLAAYGYYRAPLDQIPAAAVIQAFTELPDALERLFRAHSRTRP